MLIKEYSEMTNPEIWDLSETDDIIITKADSGDQRVLINFKIYKDLKNTLLKLQQLDSDSKLADQFDFNPFQQDFIDILHHDQFEDITDDENYFQNFARSIKSGN